MGAGWPIAVLMLLVAAVTRAQHSSRLRPLFRWLPLPLWCYALPMVAVTLGWLPMETPAAPLYKPLTQAVLPVALSLLLFTVDLPAIARTGRQALAAAGIGAVSIALAAVLGVYVLQPVLPDRAWAGAGALAGTWTGGTMNLLALQGALEIPDPVFAPLIIVDALIAYSWMALLVAASSHQAAINRWLRAAPMPPYGLESVSPPRPPAAPRIAVLIPLAIALTLAAGARALATHLPTPPLINTSGWTIVLVTTAALALSLMPPLRRLGQRAEPLGSFCLCLVLAAAGAQASLRALGATPVWIALGAFVAVCHGAALLGIGRLWRIPLGVLATASQANIGGVISAPLVGAIYDRSLVPIGLLLAMAGNALGTYIGLASAALCRRLLGG